MAELELSRTREDRNVYAIEGVGTLRLHGLFTRRATAEADATSWEIARRGTWRWGVEATDPTGAVIGEFVPRGLRRGGTVRWAGRELTLRPSSNWRERFVLVDGDRVLAELEGKGWGRRPVKVVLDDDAAIEPGLLLFTAFVVRGLAQDADAAAGAAASTAATSV
jgi:hypothetical protein